MAENTLLCNPRITSKDLLIENVSIINRIKKDKIEKVTLVDLYKMEVKVK